MLNQQYIIIYKTEVFTTDWYDKENNFCNGMIVIDQSRGVYTTDGEVWNEVEEDHL